MRFAIWSILLASLAVAIALIARQSTGYVVIVAAPYRIELSLNLLVFLVFAGYFAFYFLTRFVATLVAIPARVRAYREERARLRQRQSLDEALLAFFQGRYASAEKSAALALTGEDTKGVAAIIAARSAHELGRFSEREQFLDQAKGAEPGVDQARLTTLAEQRTDGGPFPLLDEVIEVDGGKPEPRAAQPRHGRLPGPHRPGQEDAHERSVAPPIEVALPPC